MSAKESSLRDFSSRLRKYACSRSEDPNLIKRIQLNVARLGAWYPEILVAPWTAEGAAQVDRIADEQASGNGARSLHCGTIWCIATQQ